MNRSPVLFASNESDLVSNSFARPLTLPPSSLYPTHSESKTEAAHSVFMPIHYQEGYSYPLIVWLHGPESNEEEVHQAVPLVSVRNYVAIAPRGNRHSTKIKGSYCWGASSDDTEIAATRVASCIDFAQSCFNIHPERIFLAGHRCGGTIALRLAMEYPELCSGAISFGGRVPTGDRPLKRIYDAERVPFLLSVSPTDAYTLDHVMNELRLLHSAGFPLDLRLYPEGDGLTTDMLSHADTWIMNQACPETVVSDC